MVETEKPELDAEPSELSGDGWKRGLPALAVGAIAVLVAVYGTFALPKRLPDFYASAKEEVSAEYQKLVDQGESNPRQLQRAGAELDIVYSRLVALQRQDAGLIWEWGSFLDDHATTLQRRLSDAVASFSEEERKAIEQQQAEFRQKASRNFEILAAGDSQFTFPATLRLVEAEYRRGLAQFGVAGAAEFAQRLADAIQALEGDAGRSQASDNSFTGEQTRDQTLELRRGRLLQSRLWLEAAWQQTPGSRLSCDEDLIQRAAEVLAAGSELTDAATETSAKVDSGATLGSTDADRAACWTITQQLIEAYAGRRQESASGGVESLGALMRPSGGDEAAGGDWLHAVCDIEAACLAGDWEGAGFLLARQRTSGDMMAAAVMGRTVCRLAVSPAPIEDEARDATDGEDAVATAAWQPRLDFGLQLVSQAAAFVPEFSELLWGAAIGKLDAGESSSAVSSTLDPKAAKRIGDLIAAGPSAELKHAMFALSAAMRGELQPAKSHMQLAKRSGGNLIVLSRVVLWRAQSTSREESIDQLKPLASLLEVGSELEAENGLLWFALGVVQSRLAKSDPESAEAAIVSLTRAKELLGNVPAIAELMQALEQR